MPLKEQPVDLCSGGAGCGCSRLVALPCIKEQCRAGHQLHQLWVYDWKLAFQHNFVNYIKHAVHYTLHTYVQIVTLASPDMVDQHE